MEYDGNKKLFWMNCEQMSQKVKMDDLSFGVNRQKKKKKKVNSNSLGEAKSGNLKLSNTERQQVSKPNSGRVKFHFFYIITTQYHHRPCNCSSFCY